MMKVHQYMCLALLMLAIVSVHTRADDYASNRAYVKASPNGECYAKAIPAELYGSEGVTKIYVVGREGEDRLVETYPWYTQQMDLQTTAWGISVVRVGSWRRGQKPSQSDLAIGLYLAGKPLREYSTFDIAHLANASVGVFSALLKVNGYRWIRSNDYVFEVEAGEKMISFDVRTGAVVEVPPNTSWLRARDVMRSGGPIP